MPPNLGWTAVQRRHGLSADAAHVVLQATQISSFPLAQEVIRQLSNLYASLRAPQRDSSDVQSLIDNIEGTIHILDNAAGELGDLWTDDANNLTLLEELQRFYDQLAASLARLQGSQSHGFTHKLLHHVSLQELVEQTREELMNTTFRLTVQLAVLGAWHSRRALALFQRDAMEGHEDLVREVRSLMKRGDAMIVSSVSIVLFK